MWNKFTIVTLRILAIIGVFIAPTLHLFIAYSGEEIIESTQSSMPMGILLVISIFVLILIMWLGSQVLVVYWEYVKKHPFGEVTIFTFGTVILAISFLLIQWINKFSELINYNSVLFIADLETYKQSMAWIVMYVSIGLACAIGSFIWRKATE